MVQLWHGMPTAEAEIAPVVQYSKMLWKATTNRDDAASRGASLADIRRMWEAAQVKFAPLAQTILDARGSDGTVPAKISRRVWGEVAGPMAAAAVTLARLGWQFINAFEIKDTSGVVHTLTTASPCLVKDLLRGAMREAFERKIGGNMAKSHPSFQNRRACVDLAMRFAKPGRRCTRQEAACFRSVACGAVWTAAVAKERGYITDGLCPLCRTAPDTVRHRTYFCPCTADAVAAAVPKWFLEEAARGGAHTPFWTSAIIPHPADATPPPRHDTYCEVERHTSSRGGGTADSDLTHLAGRIYVDGSCFPSWIRGLARAACAVVMTSDAGEPLKTLQIPVPRHLPQTSQAAEYLGMAVAYKYATGASELIGDCVNVVRAFTGPARKALAPTRKYAGIVLSAMADPAKRRCVSVRWTKAHRAADGDEAPSEAADIRGNAAADEAAKLAAALHPRPDATVMADVDFYSKRAPLVVKAVSTAMACFPKAPTGMARAPKPATEAEARVRQRHMWRHTAGAWRCTLCNDFITSRAIPAYRRHQRCRGQGMAEDAPGYANLGHALVRTDGDLPIIGCTKCGAWGNRRTRKLGLPCAAPTRAGEQAVKRILAGKHPLLQKTPSGIPLPRADITITARYDASRGAWVSTEPRLNQPSHGTASVGTDRDAAAIAPQPPHHDHLVTAPPPHPVDDVDPFDEEDVFGHGGGLDLLDDRMDDDPGQGDGTRSTVAPREAARPPAHPAEQPAALAATRRRRRDNADAGPRDFVGEAVQRLGGALRRNDTDAAGRMARLRQRVQEKAMKTRDREEQLGEHGDGGETKRLRRNVPAGGGHDEEAGGEERHADGADVEDARRDPHRLVGDDPGAHLHQQDALGPGDARGRKRPRSRGSRSQDPPLPRRPQPRGGVCGDPGRTQESQDQGSKHALFSRFFLFTSHSPSSTGGPAGIGGARAPTPSTESIKRGADSQRLGDAAAIIGTAGGDDGSSWEDTGVRGAAARPALGRPPGANAADAANAASVPTPGPASALVAQDGACRRAQGPLPVNEGPTTRAELIRVLRGADGAAGKGGARSRDAAAAYGDRLIRRRCGTVTAAAATAASNGGAAIASGNADTERVAGEAAVIGGPADAVSAWPNPVPRSVTAGVEVAAGRPLSADAASAPARRRITGKQRGSACNHCLPIEAAASLRSDTRQEVSHGRARAVLPPD